MATVFAIFQPKYLEKQHKISKGIENRMDSKKDPELIAKNQCVYKWSLQVIEFVQ